MPASRLRKHDSDATRQNILAAATRQFSCRGMEGARIDEIASVARVNKRMIYVYFGSKEGLYLEVLRQHFDRVLELSRLPGPASDPRAEVEAVIRRYFHFLADNPDFVRLLSWEVLSDIRRARSLLQGRFSAGLESLHELIRAGIRQGAFRVDLDVRQVVMSVNALCIGLFTHRPVLEEFWQEELHSPEAIERSLQGLINMVFSGVCTPPQPAEASSGT